MSKSAVVFEAPRDGYTIKQIEDKALTIGEVIDILSQFDEDDLFVLSHDNGYTYGSIERYPEYREVEEEEE